MGFFFFFCWGNSIHLGWWLVIKILNQEGHEKKSRKWACLRIVMIKANTGVTWALMIEILEEYWTDFRILFGCAHVEILFRLFSPAAFLEAVGGISVEQCVVFATISACHQSAGC